MEVKSEMTALGITNAGAIIPEASIQPPCTKAFHTGSSARTRSLASGRCKIEGTRFRFAITLQNAYHKSWVVLEYCSMSTNYQARALDKANLSV